MSEVAGFQRLCFPGTCAAAYLWQMFYLEEVRLGQFKNYEEARLTLGPQVNCFSGRNGSGKTNLLDAVYYLSFTKGFFHSSDLHHLKHGEEWFSVEGHYEKGNLKETVRLTFQKGKKSLKVNNNEVRPFSEHIGSYPLVMITPNDIMLVHEGSEERRKFLDGMIAQLDKEYLYDLLRYNRVTEQRNRSLKAFAEGGYVDEALLETYDMQLVASGESIHLKRKAFLENFIPVFRKYYAEISGSAEPVNIEYESQLNDQPFKQLLEQFRPQDLASQRTGKGIHKDELVFVIGGHPLKRVGSQGQQKSFIISLKLAQYDYLADKTGTRPLLLLDDIFEKLDGARLQKLLTLISEDHFGQILITDTHLERMQSYFNEMKQVRIKYFGVDKGTINEL